MFIFYFLLLWLSGVGASFGLLCILGEEERKREGGKEGRKAVQIILFVKLSEFSEDIKLAIFTKNCVTSLNNTPQHGLPNPLIL